MTEARRINPFTIDAGGVGDGGPRYGSARMGRSRRRWRRRRGESACERNASHLRDFMRATSMHGLKYAADEEASCFERFVWIALFLVGLGTAVFFIMRTWSKWESSPVLISVESTDYPNSRIAFPAVSVCNVNQASDDTIMKLVQRPFYREANVSREDLLELLSSLMKGVVRNVTQNDIQTIEKNLHLDQLTAANLTHFMQQVAQSCSQMILHCEWQTKIVNCSQFFQLIPSNQGFCCVFNMQAVHEQREPLKANGEGVYMGLNVLLDARVHDYTWISSYFRGFKVLIHNSEDQPDPSTKGLAVSPGSEVYVGVSAASIFSTDDVKRLAPAKRNCRFGYENELQYFSRYSQSNCYLERMAKRIIKQCQCLPFYFLIGSSITPTCRFEKNECIKGAFHDFHRKENRNCPANCNATWYSADISQGDLSIEDFRASRLANWTMSTGYTENDSILRNMVVLHVFFRDRSGILYRRDVRYEWQDFVSAVGGLLGLFIGFSLLSLMEIFYFCGFRSCLRRQRYAPERKSVLTATWKPLPTTALTVTGHNVQADLYSKLFFHKPLSHESISE